MKKTLKVIIALALVLMTLSPLALAASKSAQVIVGSMTVYNTGKKKVGSLPRGTKITVVGYSGKWVKIKYKGKKLLAHEGSVMLRKGTAAKTTKDAYFEFVTKSSYRQGMYYKATLAAGTKVYIVGRKGGKYLVKNPKGNAMGYIAKSAVSTK